ncbi:restriction endonuclease [Paenibacillus thermotolerans]|uniref:restriction endonuclease n=1 Tax=Paenibacillus thermotolerans TaxID=3027807 RepID=UPI002367B978|nr:MULTISPECIES: restriction endonuclease [unclassified Paenibacillus]
MARRRKNDGIPTEWILLIVPAFIVSLFFASITNSSEAGFYLGLVTFFITIFYYRQYIKNIEQERINRLKRSGITDIDMMNGLQFEQFLGVLFKSQGYDTLVTKSSGDYGADLVIVKDGRKIVVQAKRYSGAVNLKAVQEAVASIAHYGAAEAWVVTNSNFSPSAVQLARSNNVRLIDRNSLIEMLLEMNQRNE